MVEDLTKIDCSDVGDFDYIIAVRELIYSVRDSIYKIISDEAYSTNCIDGKFNAKYPRRLAEHVTITGLGGFDASASKAGN